ncbi:MAG: hypothetical protein ACRCTY_04300 [Candidatus Adiutrix sp.]
MVGGQNNFKVGILGGGLQGIEASLLARWAGWKSHLVDARPRPPAFSLVDSFTQVAIDSPTRPSSPF